MFHVTTLPDSVTASTGNSSLREGISLYSGFKFNRLLISVIYTPNWGSQTSLSKLTKYETKISDYSVSLCERLGTNLRTYCLMRLPRVSVWNHVLLAQTFLFFPSLWPHKSAITSYTPEAAVVIHTFFKLHSSKVFTILNFMGSLMRLCANSRGF